MTKEHAPDLWKKLMIIGEKQGAIKLQDLAREIDLAPEETLSFLRQVFPSGVGIEIYQQDNDCWLDIKSEAIQYMLPLSPLEWMELHQLLDKQVAAKNTAMLSLKRKISENSPIKAVMELLSQLEMWDIEMSELQQKTVKQLEDAIREKKTIQLTTAENKTYSMFPCKVIHLEGLLSLIAEDTMDHCLFVVPLKDVKELSSMESHREAQVTAFEIEEFITAIRDMNEKETRLILKIHEPHSTNLFPENHFLGKPCMITNSSGDLIWAAYVEPCEALYEWLLSLGQKVEILDPVNFKEEYLMYCEEKLRKIA